MFILPTRKSKAFTLLELIVVIVILGILAAIAIPTFQKVIAKSHDSAAKQTAAAVLREAQALAAFRGDGTFTDEDMTAAMSDLAALDVGVSAARKYKVDPTPGDAPAAGEVNYHLTADKTTASVVVLSDSGAYVSGTATAAGAVRTSIASAKTASLVNNEAPPIPDIPNDGTGYAAAYVTLPGLASTATVRANLSAAGMFNYPNSGAHAGGDIWQFTATSAVARHTPAGAVQVQSVEIGMARYSNMNGVWSNNDCTMMGVGSTYCPVDPATIKASGGVVVATVAEDLANPTVNTASATISATAVAPGGTFTVSIPVSDDVSGVGTQFGTSYFKPDVSPGSSSATASAMNGDYAVANGVLTMTFRVPANAPLGAWHFDWLEVRDNLGRGGYVPQPALNITVQ